MKKGATIRIECTASGNPSPNITWTRRNNLLPNGNWFFFLYKKEKQFSNFLFIPTKKNYLGEDKLVSSILSIENMDRHKGGVYICTANNGVGEPALSQVSVHVLCECSFVFIKIIYKINRVYTFQYYFI